MGSMVISQTHVSCNWYKNILISFDASDVGVRWVMNWEESGVIWENPSGRTGDQTISLAPQGIQRGRACLPLHQLWGYGGIQHVSLYTIILCSQRP